MHTSFDQETWQSFKASDRAGPIHMLNLIRLHETAHYPDCRTTTGIQAYERYSEISAPVLKRLDASVVWRGKFELMMVGPSNEVWDICFIAEYPSVGSFVKMMRDPLYQEAMKHRQVGVANSRLVRMQPLQPGSSFADKDTHS
ncbi:MAG: DUF1330 domain-containing protein [Planctomycetota bacterium]